MVGEFGGGQLKASKEQNLTLKQKILLKLRFFIQWILGKGKKNGERNRDKKKKKSWGKFLGKFGFKNFIFFLLFVFKKFGPLLNIILKVGGFCKFKKKKGDNFSLGQKFLLF